jgi:hypothetical protein
MALDWAGALLICGAFSMLTVRVAAAVQKNQAVRAQLQQHYTAEALAKANSWGLAAAV